MNYTQITTVSLALKALGMDVKARPDVSGYPEHKRAHKTIEFELMMVNRAINEGWTPNWQDSDEEKHYPWWYVGGSGFSLDDVLFVNSHSYVGPRLVFRDRARAAHAAAFFVDLYRAYYYGSGKADSKKGKPSKGTKSYLGIKSLSNIGVESEIVYPDFKLWPEDMQVYKRTEFKLEMVTDAINEGWTPNWQDKGENKHYPCWCVGGSGFSLCGVLYDDSDTRVGPRLVFRDRSRAAHAAAYFEPLYRELYYGVEVVLQTGPEPEPSVPEQNTYPANLSKYMSDIANGNYPSTSAGWYAFTAAIDEVCADAAKWHKVRMLVKGME